jgi:hypothetical protein
MYQSTVQVLGALRSQGWSRLRRALVRRQERVADLLEDDRGSQITDNLGLIVIGVVAIVAIGGLISGLDSTIFTWISGQLGISS